jgi:hypothetical protein
VLGLQPLLGGTNWASELTTTSGSSPPTALTIASTTAAKNVSGGALSSTDIANGNFAATVRATRNGGAGDVDTTALLDALRARATYITTPTTTVDYSGFGFDIPTARDLMRVTAAVKWRLDTANSNVTLGFQAYKDGGLTPIGSETTTTVGSSPPTTDTVVSTDLDISSLTPVDVNSSSFLVRVRATRGATTTPNSDFSAFLDYVSLTATYGTTTGGNLAECNPYNNWSATKLNPDPTPCMDQTTIAYPKWTMTRVFEAQCPIDKGSSWSFFVYDSVTPGDSKINFRFRTFSPTNGTCVPLPAITTSPPAPLAIAHASPNTQVCQLGGGVPGCPVDLYAGLGVPAVFAPCLQMDARGIPDSGGAGSPTLKDWAVRFDCVDNQ